MHRRPRDLAEISAEDFAALKHGPTHHFTITQPDGRPAPVQVSINRQGKQALRMVFLDLVKTSYNLSPAASKRFTEEYTEYYRNRIDRKLYKHLHIPTGKSQITMSVLTEDVGEWLYRAARMVLDSANLVHIAPELADALASMPR